MDSENKHSQTLTSALRKCLQASDQFAMIELRDKINFSVILKSNEPTFLDIKREHGLKEIIKPVTAISESFLNTCYPEQSFMALNIAVAITEREPTWTLPDVVNFYKTIINRQDLEGFQVMGNKITVIRLMEMVATYEELKAEERERIVAEEKGKYTEPTLRGNSENSIKDIMGKEFERVIVKNNGEETPVKIYSTPANEQWFNRNPISPDQK